MQGTINRLSAFAKYVLLSSTLILGACNSDDPEPPPLDFVLNSFEPFETYQNWCGIDHQLFFVRSLLLELYAWGEDITDSDPRLSYNDPFDYFYDQLNEETATTGRARDPWSFISATTSFVQSSTFGAQESYGFHLAFSEAFGEGDITIAYTVAGSPAKLAGVARGDQIISVNSINVSSGDRDEIIRLLYPFSAGETIELDLQRHADASLYTVNLTSDYVIFPPVQNVKTIDDVPVFGSAESATVGHLQFHDHTSVSAEDLVNAFTEFSDEGIDELVIDLRYNSGGFLSIANLTTSMIIGESTKIGKYFARLNIPNNNADRRFFPENENIPFIEEYNGDPIPNVDLNRVFVLTTKETCSASEALINGLRSVGVEVIQIGETTCGKPFGFYQFPSCGYSYFPVAFQSFGYNNSDSYELGFTTSSTSAFDIELDGREVSDDFGQPLGDEAEGQFAAALGYISNNSCPPVISTLLENQSALQQSASEQNQLSTGNRARSQSLRALPQRNVMIRQLETDFTR